MTLSMQHSNHQGKSYYPEVEYKVSLLIGQKYFSCSWSPCSVLNGHSQLEYSSSENTMRNDCQWSGREKHRQRDKVGASQERSS